MSDFICQGFEHEERTEDRIYPHPHKQLTAEVLTCRSQTECRRSMTTGFENVLKHPPTGCSCTHLPISAHLRHGENSSTEYLCNRRVFRWVPRQRVVGKNTPVFSQGTSTFVEKRLKVPFSQKNLHLETPFKVSCLAEAIHRAIGAMCRKADLGCSTAEVHRERQYGN